jgi:hypothetical protein
MPGSAPWFFAIQRVDMSPGAVPGRLDWLLKLKLHGAGIKN